MSIFKTIGRKVNVAFRSPLLVPIKILEAFPGLSSDEFFLKLQFKQRMGHSLNLKDPRTFNEKLNWLKIYYRKPEMSKLVDKYEVKKIVSNKIGSEHVIPTYGVWKNFDDISFDELPNQFVLKTTHDGGGVVVCTNKATFDIDKAKKKLNRHLKTNHYNYSREWPYKNVEPRILAEEYMVDPVDSELRDYKFFCFNGEPKALFIASDRQKAGDEVKFDYFDVEFNRLDIKQSHPNSNLQFQKPKTFEEMKANARILAKGFPHVRIDFYEVNGRMFFGEITFFHYAGLTPFYPEKWDYIFGNYIKLPPQ